MPNLTGRKDNKVKVSSPYVKAWALLSIAAFRLSDVVEFLHTLLNKPLCLGQRPTPTRNLTPLACMDTSGEAVKNCKEAK